MSELSSNNLPCVCFLVEKVICQILTEVIDLPIHVFKETGIVCDIQNSLGKKSKRFWGEMLISAMFVDIKDKKEHKLVCSFYSSKALFVFKRHI